MIIQHMIKANSLFPHFGPNLSPKMVPNCLQKIFFIIILIYLCIFLPAFLSWPPCLLCAHSFIQHIHNNTTTAVWWTPFPNQTDQYTGGLVLKIYECL